MRLLVLGKVLLGVAGWILLSTPSAHAGCEGKSNWETYKAGDEYVDYRGCKEYGTTQVDILNTHDYPLCVTVVGLKSNLHWNDWPLAPGAILNKRVNLPDENFRIGAVEKTKSSCR